LTCGIEKQQGCAVIHIILKVAVLVGFDEVRDPQLDGQGLDLFV
jgi:hypothetical protein